MVDLSLGSYNGNTLGYNGEKQLSNLKLAVSLFSAAKLVNITPIFARFMVDIFRTISWMLMGATNRQHEWKLWICHSLIRIGATQYACI